MYTRTMALGHVFRVQMTEKHAAYWHANNRNVHTHTHLCKGNFSIRIHSIQVSALVTIGKYALLSSARRNFTETAHPENPQEINPIRTKRNKNNNIPVEYDFFLIHF